MKTGHPTDAEATPTDAERVYAVSEVFEDVSYLGHIDEANRFFVTGWVADKDNWSRPLRVDILVNDRLVGIIEASELREGLRALDPSATGRYVFRFYYVDPLSMFMDNRVCVRVTGTDVYLPGQKVSIPAVGSDSSALVGRPSEQILLTTCGRTGSTAIMAELKQHPNIVVAGARPYEIELGSYYAYALRTLSAFGDPERSLRADQITARENRFHIGFNPYFEQALASLVFKDPARLSHILHDRVPTRLAHAFREIILDYYQDVASDQDIAHPIYFAEKCLPERDARLGIRFMFPNIREIVLVRDYRDIVCSSMATKGANFDRIFQDTLANAEMFETILTMSAGSVMLLKYEDYIEDKQVTLKRIFNFLGLGLPASQDAMMQALFDVHSTSESPAASIARWRRDLAAPQQAQCEVFNPYLERLGYPI